MRSSKSNRAFTLVEILIVVSILGILAAIVLPQYQAHTQKARESAAKENLRIMRNAIEIYASQHNGIAPGYVNGNTVFGVAQYFFDQLTTASNELGQCGTKSVDYPLGPYVTEIPANPFSSSSNVVITLLQKTDNFPVTPDGSTDWIYKPYTKEIRLNKDGTDSEGIAYYSY